MQASRFDFALTDRFEDAIEQGISMGRDILMPDEDIAWANAHSQFPATRRLPGWLMLSDGGVFDNLAVDWFLENEARLSRFRMGLNWDYNPREDGWSGVEARERDEAILSPFKDVPESLVVVNAGITAHWQRGSSAMVSVPFVGEVIGLSQISGTMYNNYTKERIRALEQHLVIELGFAERLVKTTLLPLGTDVTARLMRAGYSGAMHAAARRFGHPLLEVGDAEFTGLARGLHPRRARKLGVARRGFGDGGPPRLISLRRTSTALATGSMCDVLEKRSA